VYILEENKCFKNLLKNISGHPAHEYTGSYYCRPGLPDGLFLNPKIPIWVYFGGP
jgi:hypothetical protein